MQAADLWIPGTEAIRAMKARGIANAEDKVHQLVRSGKLAPWRFEVQDGLTYRTPVEPKDYERWAADVLFDKDSLRDLGLLSRAPSQCQAAVGVVRGPPPPEKPFLTAGEALAWIAWGSTESIAQFEGDLISFWGHEPSDDLADALAAGNKYAQKVQAGIQSREGRMIPFNKLSERLESDRAKLAHKYEMLSRASDELIAAGVNERLQGHARPNPKWEPNERGKEVLYEIIPHKVFIQDGVTVTWIDTLEIAGRQIAHDVRFRRSDVLTLWPPIQPATSAPLKAAVPASKEGRPTHIAEVHAELDKMKSENGARLNGSRADLAKQVAKRCGAKLGDDGWALRTVTDHIRQWFNPRTE